MTFSELWRRFRTVRFQAWPNESSLNPHVPELRLNSVQTEGRLVRMMDKNGGKFERFQKLQKFAFYRNQNFFSQKFSEWYIESNKKMKTLTLYGHLKFLCSSWIFPSPSYYRTRHYCFYDFLFSSGCTNCYNSWFNLLTANAWSSVLHLCLR